jgi:hypothetical protein
VAGGVEEGDLAPVVLDLVRADVLRDAAGLAGGDVRLADRVEERGLAVVDMAEDDNDRGLGTMSFDSSSTGFALSFSFSF